MTSVRRLCDPDEDPEEVPYGDGLEAEHERLSIDVEVTDPAVVGELYGPDGAVLAVVYDRTVVPFGFQAP